MDPSLENMDVPKTLVAAFLADVHCNERHVHDVCCDALEYSRCVLDDEFLFCVRVCVCGLYKQATN